MYNRVILIGNIGQDVEPRYNTGGERAVLNIRVATNRRWVDRSGEPQQRTEWHTVVYWVPAGRAETLAEKLKKGTLVFVDGEIRYRQWEDRNGNTRNVTEIRAWRVIPLTRRGAAVGEASLAEEAVLEQEAEVLDEQTPEVPNIDSKEELGPTDNVPF